MKKTILLFLLAALVIGLAVPSLSHPFFIYLKNNLLDEAEKLGVQIITADAGGLAGRNWVCLGLFWRGRREKIPP